MKYILTISLNIFCLLTQAQTERGPNSIAESVYAQGYMFLEKGEYKEAKKHFILAIRMDSSDLNYYLSIARIGFKTSNWTLADSIYNAAKKVFPDNPNLFMYAGDVLQNLKNLQLAIENYSTAIALSGNDTSNEQLYLYHFNRGNSHLQLKKYQDAISDYNITLQLFPGFNDAYRNRGVAKYYNKNKIGACDDWRKASENGYKVVDTYIKQYCID